MWFFKEKKAFNGRESTDHRHEATTVVGELGVDYEINMLYWFTLCYFCIRRFYFKWFKLYKVWFERFSVASEEESEALSIFYDSDIISEGKYFDLILIMLERIV